MIDPIRGMAAEFVGSMSVILIGGLLRDHRPGRPPQELQRVQDEQCTEDAELDDNQDTLLVADDSAILCGE